MAVFLASDKASGMTGTVVNLTGRMIVDQIIPGGSEAPTRKYSALIVYGHLPVGRDPNPYAAGINFSSLRR